MIQPGVLKREIVSKLRVRLTLAVSVPHNFFLNDCIHGFNLFTAEHDQTIIAA